MPANKSLQLGHERYVSKINDRRSDGQVVLGSGLGVLQLHQHVGNCRRTDVVLDKLLSVLLPDFLAHLDQLDLLGAVPWHVLVGKEWFSEPVKVASGPLVAPLLRPEERRILFVWLMETGYGLEQPRDHLPGVGVGGLRHHEFSNFLAHDRHGLGVVKVDDGLDQAPHAEVKVHLARQGVELSVLADVGQYRCFLVVIAVKYIKESVGAEARDGDCQSVDHTVVAKLELGHAMAAEDLKWLQRVASSQQMLLQPGGVALAVIGHEVAEQPHGIRQEQELVLVGEACAHLLGEVAHEKQAAQVRVRLLALDLVVVGKDAIVD